MNTPLPRGILIAFEGIDGAGKTTQLRRVAAALAHAGLVVVTSKEPTDGPHGARIRRSATEGRMPPEEELNAFLADRREHVERLIGPALAAGKVVLVDRYYFSSVAYQGARGLSPASVLETNEAFAPRPDLVVLLDVPPEVGLARVRSRDANENLFEQLDELAKARAIFAILAGEHIRRFDGTAQVEPLTGEILAALLDGPLRRALPGPTDAAPDPRWTALAAALRPSA